MQGAGCERGMHAPSKCSTHNPTLGRDVQVSFLERARVQAAIPHHITLQPIPCTWAGMCERGSMGRGQRGNQHAGAVQNQAGHSVQQTGQAEA